MQILYLSSEYPPETGGGGIGSYTAELARSLAATGHEVHVLSCAPNQPARDYLDGSVQVHRRPDMHLPLLGRFLHSPEGARRVERALGCWWHSRRLKIEPDVIEAPEWMAEGLCFALTRSTPLVMHLHTPLHLVTIHNGRPFTWRIRLGDQLERVAVNRAHRLTAPSRFIANELMSSGWLTKDPVTIRTPIDLTLWRAIPPPSLAPPRILQVGRLETRKAPELLVDALALLSQEQVAAEALFIGRSGLTDRGERYRDWLESRVKRLEVHASFVESLPRLNLPGALAESRLVVVPSWWENFSTAGIEAMAAARPVVCASSSGLAELIVDSGAGAVIPPGRPDLLAAAMRPFLCDPDLADAAGERARGAIELHCSPDIVAEQKARIYNSAIGDAAHRGRRRPSTRLMS